VSLNGIPLNATDKNLVNVFLKNDVAGFSADLAENIADMKADGAEAIVLYIHRGNEYQLKPNSYQTTIAQKMCDLGVDVIVGGHPHVIQPIDILTSSVSGKKTVCAYSVGNELSNQRIAYMDMKTGHTEDGMVLQTTPELSSIAQIPALWKRMQVREQENKLYALARPREHGEYYISFPVGTGLFRLITGVKIDAPEELDNSLYVDWVPPGLYGIFSPPPVFGDSDRFAEAVKQTWRYIFDQWLPDSGYCLDEKRLDYECYDERCHGKGPFSMDICVPLKINEKEKENV
jgi:predicted transcriptional regulator YdeE